MSGDASRWCICPGVLWGNRGFSLPHDGEVIHQHRGINKGITQLNAKVRIQRPTRRFPDLLVGMFIDVIMIFNTSLQSAFVTIT